VTRDSETERELNHLLVATQALRQRYRQVSQEEPRSALDQAIRAAARRSLPQVGYGGRKRVSWTVSASVAALIVLSATITIMVAQQDAHLPLATQKQVTQPPNQLTPRDASPGGAQRSEQAAAPSHSRAAPRLAPGAPAAKSEQVEPVRPGADKQGLPEGSPTPGPAAPVAAPNQSMEAGANTLVAPSGTAAAVDALSAKKDAASSPQIRAQARGAGAPTWQTDPQAWLEHIEQLRARGRFEEADGSLREFRNRYPDYPLPLASPAPAR